MSSVDGLITSGFCYPNWLLPVLLIVSSSRSYCKVQFNLVGRPPIKSIWVIRLEWELIGLKPKNSFPLGCKHFILYHVIYTTTSAHQWLINDSSMTHWWLIIISHVFRYGFSTFALNIRFSIGFEFVESIVTSKIETSERDSILFSPLISNTLNNESLIWVIVIMSHCLTVYHYRHKVEVTFLMV